MSEPSLENVKILSQYNFVTLSHDLVVDGITIPSGTNVLLAPQTMAQCVRVPGPMSLYEAWDTLSKTDHTHTPEQCSAAPLNHTHKPADIGAANVTHTHTPEQCSAAPLNHTHKPADIGAANANHTHPDLQNDISEINGKATTANENASNALTAARNCIVKSGDRGLLQGKETVSVVSGSQTITVDSPDTIVINTSGTTTLTFTATNINTTAVKVIALKNGTTTSTITISGATWANNGEAPTWGSANSNLILVANFIAGRVILNVFDNTEG